MSKKMSDAEYFASEEFKRRAEAQARQSFNITPLAESERIYRVTTVSEVQRVDEPTPNGGDYSEIIYMDDSFDVVDEVVATKCVIRECTADGSLVCETFGTFS